MFAALKRESGRRAGKGEKETDLKLEKTFQSLWTSCRTYSQQVAYPIDHQESPICKWCKEQVCCLSSKKPNIDKLRDKLGRNFWDGTFFLLIAVAEPLEANTESSSEEVSYTHFFDSDIFSHLKEFRLCSEPMFEPKPTSLLQDSMRVYKRAHIPFEHGGHVKKEDRITLVAIA